MKDDYKGEPKLSTYQLVKFYRKVLQLAGRDFDAEFEEYKTEKLNQTRDEYVD